MICYCFLFSFFFFLVLFFVIRVTLTGLRLRGSVPGRNVSYGRRPWSRRIERTGRIGRSWRWWWSPLPSIAPSTSPSTSPGIGSSWTKQTNLTNQTNQTNRPGRPTGPVAPAAPVGPKEGDCRASSSARGAGAHRCRISPHPATIESSQQWICDLCEFLSAPWLSWIITFSLLVLW